MTGILFLAAFAGLPLVGAGPVLWRGRGMKFAGAVAAATAVGAVGLTAEMLALTVLRVRWTPGLLLVAPALALAASLRGRTDRAPWLRPPARRVSPLPLLFWGIAGAALAIVAYAAMTARATSSDLLFFWGSKGEHFGLEGRIGAEFLRRPDHESMHPDYPPLWPCLYAFGTMLAGRFAWGASLATLPFFLALAVVAVGSFARPRIGAVEASALAAAFAALFGFLLLDGVTAGGADPPLLFFETLALGLVIFAREEPGAFFFAGICLAGAAWTKLEGIAFGWAVIAAAVLSIRPLSRRDLARLAVPPLLAYGTWIAFCRAHGLLVTLGPHELVLTPERLRVIASGMLRAASLGCGYAPWALAALLLVIRRPGRAAVLPVLVAALVAAFDGGIYLIARGDPSPWIAMAGPRTLMTPVLALLLAAMAPAAVTGPGERPGSSASSRP